MLPFNLFYIFVGQAGYLGPTFVDNELAFQGQFNIHLATAFYPVLVLTEIRLGRALPVADKPFAPVIPITFGGSSEGIAPLSGSFFWLETHEAILNIKTSDMRYNLFI